MTEKRAVTPSARSVQIKKKAPLELAIAPPTPAPFMWTTGTTNPRSDPRRMMTYPDRFPASASVGVGREWRATVEDAIYTLPDIPVPNTAGRGGLYVGAYDQLRSDYALTSHVGLALEFVHFSAGPTIVSAGGHGADYLGTEVRYGW
jgi:alginate export protein